MPTSAVDTFMSPILFLFSSLGFHEAGEQCKSQSGGHLVAFEDDDEFDRLKQFLRRHVVENIRKSRFICKYVSQCFCGIHNAYIKWVLEINHTFVEKRIFTP